MTKMSDKDIADKDIEKAENGNGLSQEVSSPMKLLKFAYLSVFIDFLGLTIAIPALPYFCRRLGASDLVIGLVFSTYALASTISQAVTGYFSDKWGRRPLLLISILGSCVGFLLTGLTEVIADGINVDPVIVLFVVRFIAGIAGNSRPVATAMVVDCTTKENRAKFIGLLGATIGISFTVGPGIGAGALAIIQAIDDDRDSGTAAFSYVFFVSATLCFCGFVYAYFRLAETRNEEAASASRDGGKPTVKILSLRSPILPLVLCPVLSGYCFVTMQTTLGLLLQDVYFSNDMDASMVLGGVLFGSGWVLAAVQGKMFAKLEAKYGLPVTGAIGAVLLGGGTILVGISAHFKWHLAATLFFFFLLLIPGFALLQPTTTTLAALFSHYTGQLGAVQGLISSSQSFASVFGPAVASALYEIQIVYAWTVAGCVALLFLVPLSIAVKLHSRSQSEPAHLPPSIDSKVDDPSEI